MDYYQFYNKKTRYWQLRKFKQYVKDNNLSHWDEVQLTYGYVNFILEKKNRITKADKQFILNLGIHLTPENYIENSSRGIYSVYFLKKDTYKNTPLNNQIRELDKKLMLMNKDEMNNNINRLVMISPFPKDDLELTNKEIILTRSRFEKNISDYFINNNDASYFFSLVLFNNSYNKKPKKLKLKSGIKKKEFIGGLKLVFNNYGTKNIPKIIHDIIDIELSYLTIIKYFKMQILK